MNSVIEIEGGEDKIPIVVDEIIKRIDSLSWIGLVGELGAGKTTLTQMLLDKLRVTDEVTSPSYSLVNEYTIDEKVIEHWDLYRLQSEPEELVFSEADIRIVEWADKFPKILNRCEMIIKISISNNLRKYTISF